MEMRPWWSQQFKMLKASELFCQVFPIPNNPLHIFRDPVLRLQNCIIIITCQEHKDFNPKFCIFPGDPVQRIIIPITAELTLV